mmetsp:Transcript_13145/g.19666  ORF Transcript_13145/g.19666 Transcript_13145/m.19666 type:complete len:912 (+) Transcript_13145:99-2834(+)
MPSIAGSISSISSKIKAATGDDASSASALSWKAADDGGLDCSSPQAASKVENAAKEDGSVVSSAYAKMEEDNASKTSAVSSSYVNMDVVDADDCVSVTSKASVRSKFSVQSSNITQIAAAVLPKLEKIPLTTFLSLFVWAAIPAVIYLLLFTQMGFGESFYYALSHQFGGHAYIPATILAGYGFLFYILDIDQWNTRAGNVFRGLSMAAMFVLFVILIMLVSNKFPYGVIALFALFQPLWLLSVKTFIYKNTETRIYLNWLGGPLMLAAFLTIIGFVVWVMSDYVNQWNQVTKVMAAEHTECSPNYANYPNCMSNDGFGGTCFRANEYVDPPVLVFEANCEYSCVHVYDDCANGFVLWSGPILMSLSMIFLGSFCTFLRTEGTNETEIFNFGKIWLFVLCILWASASLAGTAAGVTTSLATLTLASLVGSAVFMTASFSKEHQENSTKAVIDRLREKYSNSLDYLRGAFIVTCLPFIAVYFLLSMINQFFRKTGFNPIAQPSKEDDSDRASLLTVKGKKQMNRMKSWDSVRVITIAIYWGIFYMGMQVVVAQLTVVFLSWLIDATADFGLVAVSGILCGVGVAMFLLPPVPGVPVYLTLGIVLAAQGYETLGWMGSISYSTAVGLVLKLFSSAMQQKAIGEQLSHKVKVRQFVSINSTLMKSMRIVLGEKGLSIPKVAILIGGPDWPTSVLCGIMRLDLFQIIVGTMPIVFLIFPTCLTGALMFMSSLETDNGNPVYPWAGSVTTVTASLTAMVQFGSMLVAAYYLEQTATRRSEEAKALGDDEEVKAADEKDEHMNKCYKDVTQWGIVPMFWKGVLLLSMASIIASCYLVQFFSELCFVQHSLTDSIEDNLGGNVANMFLPVGWVSVGLFTGSIVLLGLFSRWGKKKAKQLANSDSSDPLVDAEDPGIFC